MELRMVEAVVTVRRAKLQSNRHNQQTSTQFFCTPDALPVAQPTVSKHWMEKFRRVAAYREKSPVSLLKPIINVFAADFTLVINVSIGFKNSVERVWLWPVILLPDYRAVRECFRHICKFPLANSFLELRVRTGRTDRQMDGQHHCIMRPPHIGGSRI